MSTYVLITKSCKKKKRIAIYTYKENISKFTGKVYKDNIITYLKTYYKEKRCSCSSKVRESREKCS